MPSKEIAPGDVLYCPVYKRIKRSFNLKPTFCPDVVTCEKRIRSCMIVDDLRAECEGSRLATEEDVKQELTLQKLEAEAHPKINPQA